MNARDEEFLVVLERKFEQNDIPLSRYWGDRRQSDRAIVTELRDEARKAMDRSLQILRNRIDRFGVSEPDIQRQGTRRIVIALPGVEDPEEAKRRVGQTALLEFKILEDPVLYWETIEKIDAYLAGEMTEVSDDASPAEPAEQDAEETEAELSIDAIFGRDMQADSTEGVDTADIQISKNNPLISLLSSTRRSGREVSVEIKNVGLVDNILNREDIQELIPAGAQFLWGARDFKIADKTYRDLFFVKSEPELTGQYLTSARVQMSDDPQYAGMPQVNFTLNRTGGRIFSRVTGANLQKFLAIVLDDRVMSAPQITTKIPSGSGRITGIGDMDEARELSIVLEVGALPAPIHAIQQQTIDPTLGRDSIVKGTRSALAGLALVILFMLFYYRMAGLIADLALLLNIILLMAILAQFQFTLTLPGVAGIILTIGMAVDANVLVFERIREELKTNKTVRAAIEAGYSRAFRTILDANLTTLFTTLVLYQFGTGPVRGFAVTLSIGILVSMFTALVVTRAIFDAITAKRTLTKLSI